jgi:TPR repeat protein
MDETAADASLKMVLPQARVCRVVTSVPARTQLWAGPFPPTTRPMHRQSACTALISMILAFAPKTRGDDSTTVPELLAKAEAGDGAAQLAVAIRYRDAVGVKKDNAEAMRWGHRAADKGDAAALDFVGWMFLRGLGVKENPTLAAGYFKAAADRSATAAWNLGQCYFAAQGVEQDIPLALATWKKAAAMGHGRGGVNGGDGLSRGRWDLARPGGGAETGGTRGGIE